MKKIFTGIIIFLGTIFCFECIYANTMSQNNYNIKVYLSSQNIEIFQDNILLKTIPCSTGIKPGSTPPGKFKTYFRKEQDVWIEKDGTEIYYYYITRFNDNVAFHSMIEGDHHLVDEGKKLFSQRKTSSMGCVRLIKEDSKWIYDLPLGASVEVLDS